MGHDDGWTRVAHADMGGHVWRMTTGVDTMSHCVNEEKKAAKQAQAETELAAERPVV